MNVGTNNIISTKRLVETSDKEAYVADYHIENLPCYLEQVDPKVAVMFGENAFKTFLAIVDGEVDIAESDLVVDQNSNEYIVSGIQAFTDNEDVENHTEVTMIKKYVKP